MLSAIDTADRLALLKVVSLPSNRGEVDYCNRIDSSRRQIPDTRSYLTEYYSYSSVALANFTSQEITQ